ncbi:MULTISPECIES: hypothetical protein [unclassified Streptomyces]|uniref:hypothetical protein n=1 Tax=unclassified Streptomyces TaxID=2593676 RepID=UPI0035D6F02E
MKLSNDEAKRSGTRSTVDLWVAAAVAALCLLFLVMGERAPALGFGLGTLVVLVVVLFRRFRRTG